jgi:hypothetical protein
VDVVGEEGVSDRWCACVVQLVAYGERVIRECEKFTECLDASRRTFLAELAGFVVLPEVGIARLLRDLGRLDWRRRRSKGGLGGVYADGALALGDEGPGTFLRDDLEVVRAAGERDVDWGRRPLAEDDGPLFLPHGDVLGVVVPVIAEGIELSLEFTGDGKDEGIVGRRVVVLGTEEGECFSFEEILDFAPDERGDRCIEGHSVMRREKWVRL